MMIKSTEPVQLIEGTIDSVHLLLSLFEVDLGSLRCLFQNDSFLRKSKEGDEIEIFLYPSPSSEVSLTK